MADLDARPSQAATRVHTHPPCKSPQRSTAHSPLSQRLLRCILVGASLEVNQARLEHPDAEDEMSGHRS